MGTFEIGSPTSVASTCASTDPYGTCSASQNSSARVRSHFMSSSSLDSDLGETPSNGDAQPIAKPLVRVVVKHVSRQDSGELILTLTPKISSGIATVLAGDVRTALRKRLALSDCQNKSLRLLMASGSMMAGFRDNERLSFSGGFAKVVFASGIDTAFFGDS